jgi:hypothetical protein
MRRCVIEVSNEKYTTLYVCDDGENITIVDIPHHLSFI